MGMECRPYPGLEKPVSVLGLGAGQVGDASLPEEEAGRLLRGALDLGITLIDTARGYGLSEERIGRHLSDRRDQFTLSTKVGYGVEGIEDWTGPCVTRGVERALRVMKTDVLDIVHLHSCPRSVLERGEAAEALLECKRRGLVRIAAYSGEADDLDCAIEDGGFIGWMASLNVCDQRIIDEQLPRLSGAGFIAKRPLSNAPWRFETRPTGDYAEEYWARLRAMALDLGPEPDATALRFSAFTPGVACVITGTRRLSNLARNAEIVSRGPLDAGEYERIRLAFRTHEDGWLGQT